MTKKPYYWNKAIKVLSKKDKIMRGLILKYPDKTLTTRKDLFYSLCCLLYTSPSPRDAESSRMPSSA